MKHILWKIWTSEKGSIFIENKALLVFGLVLVFGVGNMIIGFTQDYFSGVKESIENAGVNTSFNKVIWLGKIN